MRLNFYEIDENLNKLIEELIKYDELYQQRYYDNFILYKEYKALCNLFIIPIAIIDCNLNNPNLSKLELLSLRIEFVKEFALALSKRHLDLGITKALNKTPFHQNFNAINEKSNYSKEIIQFLEHLINVYNINCTKAINNKSESLRILKCYKQKLKEYKNYNEIKNYKKQKVLSH